MRLVLISILYYIEAITFELGMLFIMKMKYDSSVTAYLSRKFEGLGERLSAHDDTLKKELYSHN